MGKPNCSVKRVEDLVARNAKLHPNKNAISYYSENGCQTTNYQALYQQICATCSQLQNFGFLPGDRIGLLAENSIDWVVSFFAILKLEATAVLIDHNSEVNILRDQIDFVELSGILVSDKHITKVQACQVNPEYIIRIQKNYTPVVSSRTLTVKHTQDGNKDYAVLVFTSGTSGRYRVAILTHENLIYPINLTADTRQKSLFTVLPWFHVFGLVISLLTPLYRASEVSIMSTLDLTLLSRTLQESKPGVIVAVPRFYELLILSIKNEIQKRGEKTYNLFSKLINFNHRLRNCTHINLGKILFTKVYKKLGGRLFMLSCGGAHLAPEHNDFLHGLGLQVLKGYGLTETSSMITSETLFRNGTKSVGRPIKGTEIDILFPEPNGIGEICAKGPGVMKSYFRNEEATANVLINGWLRTGDLGRKTRLGEIIITGRSKEVIISSNGKKAAPHEIEQHYISVPGIKEIAVVGIPSSTSHDVVHAALVVDKNHHETGMIEHKIHAIAAKLPSHLQISKIHYLDELPKTTTLKVKRVELATKIMNGQANVKPASMALPTIGENEILQTLCQLLSEVSGMKVSEINPNQYLTELGLGSLLMIQVINQLKEKYGDIIQPEKFFENLTIQELSNYFTTRTTITNISSPFHNGSQTQLNAFKHDTLFITGTTGVLGGHLLKTLLESSNAHLYCLVRSNTLSEAYDRLRKILNSYEASPQILNKLNDRITPILGDITSTQFGLNHDAYKKLASKIDMVVHCAAKVSLHGIYNDLKAVNVDGTERIIDFTLQTQQQYLVFVSSYSIMGDLYRKNCQPFTEHDFDRGQQFSNLGYQQSKFISERMVRDAQKQGLKWLIVRPGDIFGESQSGCYPLGSTQLSGIFYDIIKTILDTGCAMSSPLYFDMTPVDYVSRSMVHLIQKQNIPYQTYHLTNPSPKRYYEIVQMLQRCGYKIDLIMPEEYMDRLFQHKLQKDGKEYHSTILDLIRFNPNFVSGHEATYADASYTKSILLNAKIECPPVNEKLLKTYINYCRRVGFIQ